MNHVMMDLETWGTRPGSALRSIGAVAFELGGAIGDQFYRNIDDASCLAVGLEIDRATQVWWEKQPLEARARLMIDQRPLALVVEEFHAWFRVQGAQVVWSQGGNFDEPLWSAAARAVNAPLPWKYWNARCTRTLYDAARLDPRSITREGVHHNALDDALHQIRCVQESSARVGPRPPKTRIAYLATPYTHYMPGIEAAFQEAATLAARLIRSGANVYSPIAHSHPIALHGGIDPLDQQFWMEFDRAMMDACATLIVAQMDGWEQSSGIAHEIECFERAGKPVFYLNPVTLTMMRKERAA